MFEDLKTSLAPIIVVLVVIVGLTFYFGRFWYGVMFPADPSVSDEALLGSTDMGEVEGVQADIPQTDVPVVDLFVMAFCPFGNYAEETMYPVYELLKDHAEINLHYVVNRDGDKINSLRGQVEIDQNTREVCVGEVYGQDQMWAFLDYVNQNCGSDGDCWEQAATTGNLNITDISTCVEERGFDLMAAEAEKAERFGARASPTLFVNGIQENAVVYQYGNAEAYKNLICSAFNDEPEVCEVTLEDTPIATPGSC